jgi:hypothetical protein
MVEQTGPDVILLCRLRLVVGIGARRVMRQLPGIEGLVGAFVLLAFKALGDFRKAARASSGAMSVSLAARQDHFNA